MAIVIVPPYPQRNDPNFATIADSWNAQLPTWTDQVNATAVDVTNKQIAAAASEVAAELAETNAETAQAASEAARDLSIANASGSVATGSSIDWANKTTGVVAGGEYSAKEYAIGTTVAAGSSKDWATQIGSAVDGSEYSAKEYASGSVTPTGSSKEWATTAEDVVVAGGEYSAKHYAAKAADSVAAIPAGTINDSLIALDKAWSSTKINSELSLVTPISTMEIITTTSTFIVPATKIKVRVWGGGGSGKTGNSTSNFAGAAGGAGGGYCEKIISGLTIGASISVTIGNGGAGQTVADTAGNAGQTTSFGAYCSATGGAGGSNSASIIPLGGTGVSGDINLKGDDSFYDASANVINGGSAPMSGGFTAQRLSAAQNSPSFPGGGSAGAKSGVSTLDGAKGLCIVEY